MRQVAGHGEAARPGEWCCAGCGHPIDPAAKEIGQTIAYNVQRHERCETCGGAGAVLAGDPSAGNLLDVLPGQADSTP